MVITTVSIVSAATFNNKPDAINYKNMIQNQKFKQGDVIVTSVVEVLDEYIEAKFSYDIIKIEGISESVYRKVDSSMRIDLVNPLDGKGENEIKKKILEGALIDYFVKLNQIKRENIYVEYNNYKGMKYDQKQKKWV